MSRDVWAAVGPGEIHEPARDALDRKLAAQRLEVRPDGRSQRWQEAATTGPDAYSLAVTGRCSPERAASGN